MAELSEYHKGYNTAKKTYSKRMADQKKQYEDEIAHIDVLKTYPYNFLQEVIEELSIEDGKYLSPKRIKEVLAKYRQLLGYK